MLASMVQPGPHGVASSPMAATFAQEMREEIRSLVDPKMLEKTASFNGEDRNLGHWSFVLSSVTAVSEAEADLSLNELGEKAKRQSKVLGSSSSMRTAARR